MNNLFVLKKYGSCKNVNIYFEEIKRQQYSQKQRINFSFPKKTSSNHNNTYIVNGADISLSMWEGPYNFESSLCFGLFKRFMRLSSRSSRVFSFSNQILAPGITENASLDSDLTVLIPLRCYYVIGSSRVELLRPYMVLLAILFL